MRIAIIGAGIAGLSTAWLLKTRQQHAVTLFEAEPRAGGHTHTVDVTLDGVSHPVDTGFLVYNERTYPRFTRLLDELGVASAASEMSFSVRHDAAGIEWAGTDLKALFAQPRNAVSPRFLRMLADILRFNREATSLVARGEASSTTLGEFLESRPYGAAFRDWYLLPMAAAIWSAPRNTVLQFPLATFARFCHNHGLTAIRGRPAWRTIEGGGREYVRRVLERLDDVRLGCPALRITRRAGRIDVDSRVTREERFDAVVFACHSDQALAILADPSDDERRLLRQVRYQRNRVVLHTDDALLPRSRRAWSSWNYLAVDDPAGDRPVAVSYLINKLQPLPFARPVVVTLNPPFEPRAAATLAEFEYSHPLLDGQAIAAQPGFARLQGQRNTWYAGAWLGYGFHEDGLNSAVAVTDALTARAATRAALGGRVAA